MCAFGFLAAFINNVNQGTSVTPGSQILHYSPAAIGTHAVTITLCITLTEQKFTFDFGVSIS